MHWRPYQTAPDSADIVWKELAAFESLLLLFQDYLQVPGEQRLIVAEYYHSLLGNTQILAEAYARCHRICTFMDEYEFVNTHTRIYTHILHT